MIPLEPLPIGASSLHEVITALGGASAVLLSALAGAIVMLMRMRKEFKQTNSATEHILAETSPNHGSSMKDKVNRTADLADKLAEGQDRILDAMAQIREDIGRLAKADIADREAAMTAHEHLYEAMKLDRQRAAEDANRLFKMLELKLKG